MINKLSSLIQYQLPDFIREDHELFAAFVQAYYQWLEEQGNLSYFMSRFQNNMDVDIAEDDFLESYIKEFADAFPKTLEVDKNVLLKHIREFYLAKGSEESFKFIFTIVYNTDIEVFYPRDVILKTSDGNYLGDDYMFITADNYFKLNLVSNDLNARVQGTESGHNASIDYINFDYLGDERALRLDISSFDGPFRVGEEVNLYVEDYKVTETIYGIINKINVVDGGTDYLLGDNVIVSGGGGEGTKAKISKLKKGSYSQYDIVAPGTNYVIGDIINAIKTKWGGYGFSAKVEDVDGSGGINSIRILSAGHDYDRKGSAKIQSAAGTGATIILNGPAIGSISEVEVEDSGLGYTNPETISITVDSVNGTGATFTPTIQAIYNKNPTFLDQDGFLSNYCRLQDSYYYQQFSYVIKSNIAPNEYVQYLKKISHPAGTQLFGSLNLYNEFDLFGQLANESGSQIIITNPINLDVQYQTQIETEDSYQIFTLEYNTLCQMDSINFILDDVKFNETFGYTIEPFLNMTVAESTSLISGCGLTTNQTESAQIDVS